MTTLLIILSSLILSGFGLVGAHLFKKRGQSWFAMSLITLLFFLPLGIFLPGLSLPSPVTEVPDTQNSSWLPYLYIIWGLGVVISLLKTVYHLYAYRKWTDAAKPIEDRNTLRILQQVCKSAEINNSPSLLVSDQLQSPVIGGIRRPSLYLPKGYESWDQDTLEMVFWHEVGHLARKDLWKQLLGQATQALYWFNPFLKSLRNALSSQCELACDAWVVNRGVSRKTYLNALCNVAESASTNRSPQFALSMASHASLEDRVKTLVEQPVRKRPYAIALFLLCLTTLGLTIVSFKTSQPAIDQREIELRLRADPFPFD